MLTFQEQQAVSYPTNDVNFVIQIELKQEAGHNLRIKYDWMLPVGESYESKETETPVFKEWTLLQIEGEEPVPKEEAIPSPAKKGAPPAKGKQVEEVTDNRPRTIQYKRDIMEETGSAVKFTEQIASKFVSQYLTVEIMEGDKTIEKFFISLSEMIWPESENVFKWKFNKMHTMAIHWIEIKITTSTALLTPFLRHKLNPLMITLVACKDIPAKTDPKFKPIYARL